MNSIALRIEAHSIRREGKMLLLDKMSFYNNEFELLS
jgi:hypothetical protein